MCFIKGTNDNECAAFMGGQGPKARTIAYSETISPSLKSVPSGGNTIPDVIYPINTMVAVRGGKDDMRTCFGIGEPGDPQFTISAAHSHAVCYRETVCLQGNLIDRNIRMNGIGVSDEGVSYTLNEVDRHAVCYGIDSHPMDSRIRIQNPNEPVQTLSRKMCKGTADIPMVLIKKLEGTVIMEGNGARPSHQGPGFQVSETMYTLNTIEHHSVAYDRLNEMVYQNTGQGWWTESTVCETLRTPCGGDSMKANLIVEEINGPDK